MAGILELSRRDFNAPCEDRPRRCQYCLSETEFKENMVIDYYCPRHGFLFPSETIDGAPR